MKGDQLDGLMMATCHAQNLL